MPVRSTDEIAETKRRNGELTDEDLETLIARALMNLTSMRDNATLVLRLAEMFPGERVKRALFYACHQSAETATPAAALLAYLTGQAATPFDPGQDNLWAHFGAHVSQHNTTAALKVLAETTGVGAVIGEDDVRIAPGATPPRPDPVIVTPLHDPKPILSDWTPVFAGRPATTASTAVATPTASKRVTASTASSAPGLGPTYVVETEMRGETIHYVEPDRRTSMQFFWTREYRIEADSITQWFFPADGRRAPVTAQERVGIVARVVEYARREQGVTLAVGAEAWMHEQRRAETAAALKAAEQRWRASGDHLGVCLSVAGEWKTQMQRFLAEGREEEAVGAYHRAAGWARQYAAGATSGGEGAALSREADAFVRELRRLLGRVDPGADPDGRKGRAAVGE